MKCYTLLLTLFYYLFVMCVHLSIKFAGVHKQETSVSNITCIPGHVAIDSAALN